MQRPDRPLLAPRWLLFLMGGLVVFALAVIYPQQDLVEQVVQTPKSALSNAYVTNLLRTAPDDPQLRLLLASQALEQGNPGAVRPTLQPTLAAGDPLLRREARWLICQADIRLAQGLLPDSPEHRRSRAAIGAQLLELAADDWTAERRATMASLAFQYDQPDLGVALYRQLAEGSPNQAAAVDWYARAGAIALGHGHYRRSAELYLSARRQAGDTGQARANFLSALRTLQSGNLLADALSMAEREIGDLAGDQETLFFVTNLARAAGRPDIADRYVRRLLRLSLLRQLEQLRLAEAHGGASPRKAAWRPAERTDGPQLPFDDKAYTLGYEVFLENRKLEDAWKVAASAVRQVPDQAVWRERLAKVAEWTGRAELALDNWWQLARLTERDDAWQAVLRLAPGLLNDQAMIDALQYQVGKQPGEIRLLRELVGAWERTGEPRAALDFLAGRNRHHPAPAELEIMADLAERAADGRLALQTWQQLFKKPGEATAPRVIRAATLALALGNNQDALHWLELVRVQPGAGDSAEVLRLTGEVAENEQREELAIRAFRDLIRSGQAEPSDFDALVRLLEAPHPLEAAGFAISAWERFKTVRHLIRGLDIYATRQQWAAMGSLFGRLSPSARPPYDSLPDLQRQADFLRLRAVWHQNNGRLAEARHDITAALKLSPASRELQTAMLWLLIDSKDAPALRRFLASHEPAWRHEPSMHDGLGAAYLALSRPKVALDRYLTPHLDAHRHDFLWLMNYADALEQNQHADRAWRLRRHLLGSEWQSQASAAVDGKNGPNSKYRTWQQADPIDQARRLARSRLLITQRSGDRGLAALRELLRLDRDADGRYANAAMEAAIGWLQEAGEYSAERGHLWQQYARSRGKPDNRPLWAEISVALAEQNAAELRPLLEQYGESLPRYDRITAARQLGDLRLAQSDAFETQSEQSDDDPLHMQLAESLLEFSDHAGAELTGRQLGAFAERQVAVDWHLAINPKLSLDFRLGSIERQKVDRATIGQPPDESFTSLRINWRHDHGESTLLAEKRHSLRDYTPLQFEHEHHIDHRLSLRIGLGHHLVSQESTALRVAGMKDRLAFSLSYQPTRLDRITLEQVGERYQLQTGSAIGSGNRRTLTVSHALRQDSPDLEISAFWSAHRFHRQAAYDDPALAGLLPAGIATVGDLPASFFLPDDFNFSGIRLSTDSRYERQYTRALRPYGSIARTWHSELGAGYDVRLGLAGSLLGADHFSLTWGMAKAGVQTSAPTRELNFNYRLHY